MKTNTDSDKTVADPESGYRETKKHEINIVTFRGHLFIAYFTGPGDWPGGGEALDIAARSEHN